MVLFWVFKVQSDSQCKLILLTAATYAQNLRKHLTLLNKRVVLLHDNTRQPSVRIIQEKILDLDWSVLPHPPYSPDLASSDFCLFFFSTKWQKTFLKRIRWKCFQKTSWAQNQVNFTWEESTNYLINGKRWFKIMANILLIELLNYSWINHILL